MRKTNLQFLFFPRFHRRRKKRLDMPMNNVSVNFQNTQYTSAIGQSALLLTNKHLPSSLETWVHEDEQSTYQEDTAESSSSQCRTSTTSTPNFRSNRYGVDVDKRDTASNEYSELRKKYDFNFADDDDDDENDLDVLSDLDNRSPLLDDDDEPDYATPSNVLKLPGDDDTVPPQGTIDDTSVDYLLFPRGELESTRFLPFAHPKR